MLRLQFVNEPSDRFPFSHGSSLVCVNPQQLVCTWFSGSLEGHGDVLGLMSRLNATDLPGLSGPRWTPPTIVADGAGWPIGNPIIFPETERRWHLFYTRFPPRRSRETEIWHRISADSGQSWDEPRLISHERGYWVRHPVVVMDGRWLLPVCNVRRRPPMSQVWFSEDGGRSWSEVVIPSSEHLIQPALITWPDGTVDVFLRDMKCRHVFHAHSDDGGLNWSVPAPLDLPNNNSGISVLRSGANALIICYNDTNRRDRRSGLMVTVSHDRGRTWATPGRCVVPYVDVDAALVQYSYPSLATAPDGDVHLTLTHRASRIAHASFPPSWLGQEHARIARVVSCRAEAEPPRCHIRKLAVGEPVYLADKSAIVQEMPDWLGAGVAVCPVSSSKARRSTDAQFIELLVSVPATLVVAYDHSARRLPAWLDDWSPVAGEVWTSQGGFRLYQRHVEVGSHRLGGNRQPPATGNPAMYFSFVIPRFPGQVGR